MSSTHARTQADLVFPPQVPFSWTRRWARAHRDDRAAVLRAYRIAGSAATDAELAAAVAFCRTYAAKLELG
ncbi:MAG: hypothetical protein R6W48_05860 [Gaiellaceae bacterium]